MIHMQADSGNGNIAAEMRLKQMASNYKLTPATLATRLEPTYMPAPWIQQLSFELATTIAVGGGRVIVEAPPRHGKSRLISVWTPLWALENFPNKNVVVSSYGKDLAIEFTSVMKSYIYNNQHLLSMRLKAGEDRADNFALENGIGKYLAVGMGGPITGKGADILIIDDYIKNPEEAMSASKRQAHWDWFVSVARTRLEPGATIIIVATRWDIDDLQGRILNMQAQRDHKMATKVLTDEEKEVFSKRWKRIRYPALAEVGDPLGRKVGEALFPQRYSRAALLELKEDLGSYWFDAMFQQDPRRNLNSMVVIDNLKIITKSQIAPEQLRLMKHVRSWDLAASDDISADYTVDSRCMYQPFSEDFFIVQVERDQLLPGKIAERLKERSTDDNKTDVVEILIEQEPGSAGKNLIEQYKAHELKDLAHLVKPAATSKKKAVRAQPFLAALENGNVYIVLNDNCDPMDESTWPEWVSEFIKELKDFPAGDHDDQVDTVAAAYSHLSGRSASSGAFGRRIRSALPRGGQDSSDSPKQYTGTFGRAQGPNKTRYAKLSTTQRAIFSAQPRRMRG